MWPHEIPCTCRPTSSTMHAMEGALPYTTSTTTSADGIRARKRVYVSSASFPSFPSSFFLPCPLPAASVPTQSATGATARPVPLREGDVHGMVWTEGGGQDGGGKRTVLGPKPIPFKE